ncbi:MAG: 50S ribosomal protein L23 [Nanoarchaeota archaeon]
MSIHLRPVASEKAVKLMDLENTLVFETNRNARKESLKAEIEKLFNVKIAKIRTSVRANKKFAYVKFNVKNPAADLATRLGLI